MHKHHIKLISIIDKKSIKKISSWSEKKPSIIDLVELLSLGFSIDCTNDEDIIRGFDRDSSNLAGKAEALSRPIDEKECAIIMVACQHAKIPITINTNKYLFFLFLR